MTSRRENIDGTSSSLRKNRQSGLFSDRLRADVTVLLSCEHSFGVEKYSEPTDIEFHLVHSTESGNQMSGEVESKGGAEIEVGDTVSTPYRGGKHEFKVDCPASYCKIALTD